MFHLHGKAAAVLMAKGVAAAVAMSVSAVGAVWTVAQASSVQEWGLAALALSVFGAVSTWLYRASKRVEAVWSASLAAERAENAALRAENTALRAEVAELHRRDSDG